MILSPSELERLSLEEISSLYERIRMVLVKRIENEKSRLEETLANIREGWAGERTSPKRQIASLDAERARRKYPPVKPKYRNPADHSETWAGRGKQPRWVVAQLRAGKKMEDFVISKRDRSD